MALRRVSLTSALIALALLSAALIAEQPQHAASSGYVPTAGSAPAGRSLEGPITIVAQDLPPPTAGAAGDTRQLSPRRLAEPDPPAPGDAPRPNVIDSLDEGGHVQAAPGVSAHAFEGLDDDDNPLSVSPPDPQIAVGPNHVFEMVNNTGRIFRRDGTIVQTLSLANFFGVPDGYHDTDPKIIYDALSERWFAAYISFDDSLISADEGLLHLAVSSSSDPTASWSGYFLPYVGVVPDYPGIGITDDKVTISSNVFDIDAPSGPVSLGCFPTNGFCGVETIVLQKSDLLAGLSGPDVGILFFPWNLGRSTVRPAHSLSSTSDQYLTTFSDSTVLTVIRITGTPNDGNVASLETDLPTLAQLDPPPSDTAGIGDCIWFTMGAYENLGPPPCIDSGDSRMLEAVWRDDRLWGSASAACLPSGDVFVRSCAHLIEIETQGDPSVVQDILFGGPAGHNFSWPAIRTDASANLYVSLTHTSSSVFAEAHVVGRLATDPLNTMSGSTVLRAGQVVNSSGRWGDYLGAAVDPTDPSCVWVVGEYAKNTSGADWGTYIAATSYSGGCGGTPPTATPPPPPTPTQPSVSTATPTSPLPTTPPTATPTRTPTSAGQPGDTNCNGLANAIDAALILQWGAGLIGSLACLQNADANQNGIVDVIDATLILQFDAGLLAHLPP